MNDESSAALRTPLNPPAAACWRFRLTLVLSPHPVAIGGTSPLYPSSP